jgi:hypothetical protein
VEEANSLQSDVWDGRVIGYKCAAEECVSCTRYLGMPIVWLTYTNSPGFVMRLSVDVCIPGTGGQASTLFPCLFQQYEVLQFLLMGTEAVRTEKSSTGYSRVLRFEFRS